MRAPFARPVRNDQDREADAPETLLPEVAAEPLGTVIEVPPLCWGGRGNVVALAGVTVLDLSAAAGGALFALTRRS